MRLLPSAQLRTHSQLSHTIRDATRVSDGTSVALKFIHPSEHPYKIDISSLSSEGLASDPRNHCIPIYEVLIVPDVKVSAILVMPLLRTYNDPPFQTFGEAVDFMRQLIEVRNISALLSLWLTIGGLKGLQFMHSHHVAHRCVITVCPSSESE